MKHNHKKTDKKKKGILDDLYGIILLLGIVLAFIGLVLMINSTTINPPPPVLPYTNITIDNIPPGSLLIDTRSSDLYNTSHIGGSINIPFNSTLPGRLSFNTAVKLFDYNNRSKPHVLYGYGTTEAATIMSGIGFTDIYILTDFYRWITP